MEARRRGTLPAGGVAAAVAAAGAGGGGGGYDSDEDVYKAAAAAEAAAGGGGGKPGVDYDLDDNPIGEPLGGRGVSGWEPGEVGCRAVGRVGGVEIGRAHV